MRPDDYSAIDAPIGGHPRRGPVPEWAAVALTAVLALGALVCQASANPAEGRSTVANGVLAQAVDQTRSAGTTRRGAQVAAPPVGGLCLFDDSGDVVPAGLASQAGKLFQMDRDGALPQLRYLFEHLGCSECEYLAGLNPECPGSSPLRVPCDPLAARPRTPEEKRQGGCDCTPIRCPLEALLARERLAERPVFLITNGIDWVDAPTDPQHARRPEIGRMVATWLQRSPARRALVAAFVDRGGGKKREASLVLGLFERDVASWREPVSGSALPVALAEFHPATFAAIDVRDGLRIDPTIDLRIPSSSDPAVSTVWSARLDESFDADVQHPPPTGLVRAKVAFYDDDRYALQAAIGSGSLELFASDGSSPIPVRCRRSEGGFSCVLDVEVAGRDSVALTFGLRPAIPSSTVLGGEDSQVRRTFERLRDDLTVTALPLYWQRGRSRSAVATKVQLRFVPAIDVTSDPTRPGGADTP